MPNNALTMLQPRQQANQANATKNTVLISIHGCLVEGYVYFILLHVWAYILAVALFAFAISQ